MRINRKENSEDFFKTYVRVYSEMMIKNRDCILTDGELNFLYFIFLSIKSGRRDIYSKDIIKNVFYKNNNKLRDKRTLQTWVKLVSKKKWVTQKGNDFYISGDVESCMEKDAVNLDFNLIKNG